MDFILSILPFALILGFIFFAKEILARSNQFCLKCHTTANVSKSYAGSRIILVLLLCCFILPGIIYWIYISGTKSHKCPSCGKREMVPANSPAAQQITKSFDTKSG
ncbi:MAG: hypothetical protein AB7N80_01190 [Bdellovibrionales bacterium]